MPEGDTVYRAARRLDAALRGSALVRCDIRVPSYATVDLSGETVDEVASRGKNLLMRVGPATIRTHLKMEGRWHLYRPGERWRAPGWKARIVLGTDQYEAVGFELGLVEVLRREHEGRVLGHLGPDLLGPDWDPQIAVTNLRAAPERSIGEALLDQRNLAGIGNVYRSEICFLLRQPPDQAAGEVDLEAAVTIAAELLQDNKDRPRRRTTPPGIPADLWVYGRRGPCLRCGTPIRSTRSAGATSATGAAVGHERIVYWCPQCQRRA